MNFTLEEIIKATGAEIIINNGSTAEDKFTFSTDTRTIKQGEIYLPLKGENFDGEKFIDKALDAGAAGYFTTREIPPSSLPGLILKVPDTKKAYLELAQFCKRKIAPVTVAITGSSGKTTTKEMAYCVAKEKFRTHKSELNFNNEIGLCKTILSMAEDAQILILEMGMRGLGEIELLSKYAEPDIAIIANVGTAHIGRLGSRENIAKAKCEIVKYMKENGVLIAYGDELIKKAAKKYLSRLTEQPVYFSLDNTKIIEQKIGYSKFSYKNREYELSIEGDYNIQNSLAVIETGLALGMSEDEISAGLKKYSPLEKRWETQEVNGFKIINDSYNANPDSMRAVIKTVLDNYKPPILFVLGDMGELGKNEIQYHQEIGNYLIEKLTSYQSVCGRSEAIKNNCNDINNGISIITVGKLANEITKKLNDNNIFSKNFDSNLQTALYILDNVKVSTTIFLKASRSMKLEEVIEKIKESQERRNTKDFV